MEIREAEAEAAVMSRQTHGGDGDGVLCRHLVTVNLHEEMCGGLDCLQSRKAIAANDAYVRTLSSPR